MIHSCRLWTLPLLATVLACGLFTAQPAPTATTRPPTASGPATATAQPPRPTHSAIATVHITPTPTADPLPASLELDPQAWMTWPELPIVTRRARETYELGRGLGNDPHGFSILGDCQSTPDTFLGLYVVDEGQYYTLPEDLKETVTYFEESFTRESPTIKPGTTSGALLWAEWHENRFGCTNDETPLNCELRLNRPSFALITIGTHWEARNQVYLRRILDALLARGVVPILSTKADNREGDNRLNLEAAQLAVEYGLPLWNFWPVTEDLPDRGLYVREGEEDLGKIYLVDEALDRHRSSALEALDVVWRAVTGMPPPE
jgi:hypothetical protein